MSHRIAYAIDHLYGFMVEHVSATAALPGAVVLCTFATVGQVVMIEVIVLTGHYDGSVTTAGLESVVSDHVAADARRRVDGTQIPDEFDFAVALEVIERVPRVQTIVRILNDTNPEIPLIVAGRMSRTRTFEVHTDHAVASYLSAGRPRDLVNKAIPRSRRAGVGDDLLNHRCRAADHPGLPVLIAGCGHNCWATAGRVDYERMP